MTHKTFSEQTNIVRKDVLIVFIILLNAFAWNFMTPIMIDSVLSSLNITNAQNLIIWIAYYAAIIGSSIIGAVLSKMISRLTFLYLWIILGVFASLLLIPLSNFTVTYILVVSILLGVSFGLGMPSCLAYFADCTFVENRGRMGGIILLITNLVAALFAIPFLMFNLMANSIIFVAWRGAGLIIFFLKPKEKFVSETRRNVSFASIFKDKSFIFYFIAWLMFCLVDRSGKPIIDYASGAFYSLILIIGPIIGSFSALFGGLLSDWVGRKRIVLYGFILLGIAYAVIGIVPTASFSWYFYLVVGSVGTGMLWVIFILVLWGDLSQSGNREKYYVIGGIPYFLTGVIRLLVTPYVMLIPETSAFSLASFFLFLAVLPLLYAPETLPEKKIRLRRLRGYMEAAKKVKEKYTKKER